MSEARLKGSKTVPPYLTQCQGLLLIECPIPKPKIKFQRKFEAFEVSKGMREEGDKIEIYVAI